MSAFTDAVERGTDGLDYLSTGYLPHKSCRECPKEQLEPNMGGGWFSCAPCNCCGSELGGARYAAHGRDKDGTLVHLDVCEDCLMATSRKAEINRYSTQRAWLVIRGITYT
jgi:hypothetical protein